MNKILTVGKLKGRYLVDRIAEYVKAHWVVCQGADDRGAGR
ncbi:hypothetical protein [Paenibacillus sp. Root444D2]|nr:hypothetical protein [Paenibacillus sp. Root444D2]